MNGDTTASIVNAVFVSSRPDRAHSALVVRPYRAHLDAEPGLSARGTTESPSLPLRRHIESPFHTPIPVTTHQFLSPPSARCRPRPCSWNESSISCTPRP